MQTRDIVNDDLLLVDHVKLSKTSEILGTKNITYFSLHKIDVTDYPGNFSSFVPIKHKSANNLMNTILHIDAM